jgi:hypothetical protein
MKIRAAIGAFALAWTLGAAQAQQGAPAAASAGRAPQAARTTERSAAWTLGPGALLEGRTIRRMDARAVRSARLAARTADGAADDAYASLIDSLPRGARLMRSGGEIRFIADGRTVGMTPRQRTLFETYRASLSRREQAILEISLATLGEQDLNGLVAARTAAETARTRTEAARNSVSRTVRSRVPALERAERESRQVYQGLIARLSSKVRLRAMAEIAPLRIVHDPALAGRQGVIEGPGRRAAFGAPEGRVLFAQDLRFNRGARLAGALTARLSGRDYTFPAGTELFIAATDSGYDAHCLPHVAPRSWTRAFQERPWIPCYVDTNFDGALDSQRDGGAQIAGTYAAVGGFEPQGEVVTQAGVEELPSMDRYGQRIGVEVLESSLSGDAQEIVLAVWIAASDDAPRLTLSGVERVRAPRGGSAVATISGARIELRYTGDRTIAYRILEGLPEQPFRVD